MAELSRKSRLFLAAGKVLRRRSMRPVTRLASTMHALAYRITKGRAQSRKYPTMLLSVTGRKTGKTQTVPVIYIEDGGRYVVAAAYSGSDTDPSWWLNLQANPVAVVQVMGEAKEVHAALAAPDERPSLCQRLVTMYPYFTEYQQRTCRAIPVVTLTPVTT